MQKVVATMVHEARFLEELSRSRAIGHRDHSHYWEKVNYGLGIPAVVAATVAGTSALSEFNHHNVRGRRLGARVRCASRPHDVSRPEQERTSAPASLDPLRGVVRRVSAFSGDRRRAWRCPGEVEEPARRSGQAVQQSRRREPDHDGPTPAREIRAGLYFRHWRRLNRGHVKRDGAVRARRSGALAPEFRSFEWRINQGRTDALRQSTMRPRKPSPIRLRP
jgi:hypothetical protein